MKFDFKKLILPLIILIVLAGIVFGVIQFTKKPAEESLEPTQQETLISEDALIQSLDPATDIETDEEKIEVSGTAKSTRDTATINGKKVKVDKDGNFSKEITLKEGANEVNVEVTAPDDKKENKKIVITRKATGTVKETPETTEAPESSEKEAEKPTEGESVESKTEKGGIAAPAPAQPVVPTGEGKGTLATAGPAENAAIAFSVLGLAFYYWIRSKTSLQKAKN